jgi:hypothetical protein
MRHFLVKHQAILMCTILVLNFAISTLALVKVNSCNKVYTIGINRLTDSFTKSLNNTQMSETEQSAQVLNFGKGLEAALHDFKVQGKVLLMEEAVLSGGVDITGQVVAIIKKGGK